MSIWLTVLAAYWALAAKVNYKIDALTEKGAAQVTKKVQNAFYINWYLLLIWGSKSETNILRTKKVCVAPNYNLRHFLYPTARQKLR